MNAPKHCTECHKYDTCKQKEFMTADTQPVNGYADFDLVDYACEDCVDMSHNHCELDMDTEHDNPVHCSICGQPLNHRLSLDGIEYIKETLTDGDGCCRELWPVLFAELLE